MKLLIIRPYNVFSEQGASANRWIAILNGLKKYDVEVCLLITSGYKSIAEKKKYGRIGSIDSKLHYIYTTSQNRFSSIISRINIYLLSSFYSFQNIRQSRRIIADFKPDFIFIGPSVEVFRIIPRIDSGHRNRFKLAIELTEYDNSGEHHLTNFMQRIVQRRYTNYLLNKILPRLNVCLVISQILLDYYISLPRINSNISFLKVPIIVDFNRFKETNELSYSLRKPYIAYCGSSSFYKDGVDILIYSFKDISSLYPDLQLYIAAFWEIDGPKMVRLINDLGMNDRIIYLGTLTKEEIPSFLRNAKVLALPRPDSHQAQGGFPTKLGEYLASGIPVCATKVSEIPLYLEDNKSAFLSEPGDKKSFSDSLRRALDDETNARRIGENGRLVAETYFDINIQAERIYTFLVNQIKD